MTTTKDRSAFIATRKTSLHGRKITDDIGQVQGKSQFRSYLSSMCAAINANLGVEVAPRLRHLQDARNAAFAAMRQEAIKLYEEARPNMKGGTQERKVGVIGMKFRYYRRDAISGITDVVCLGKVVMHIPKKEQDQ